MLQVGGKPILETIIANCKKYELTDIILSVGYKADIIKSHFGDGSNFGVNVSYINEDKRMGTAGALSLMRNNLTDYFFVMNGDILTDINFNHMLNFHLSNNAVATMAVKKYDFQVPYGVVEIKNQEIKRIKEKPTHRFFINAGLYLLSNTVLDLIPNDKFFDMPALFENLIKINKKAISFPIREYWLDIGRMEEFEKANKEYTSVF
jgi:NDP-sugar pyrophosphorylase family protein